MPTSPAPPSYWRQARLPRYSLVFALPLLVAYEVLAAVLSAEGMSQVRNGADVLLKSLFVAAGGRDGLLVFGLLLVGGGAVLVWRDLRTGGGLRPAVFAGMVAESTVYALVLGGVAAMLTSWLLRGLPLAIQAGPLTSLDLPTQIMVSLGAGIYEELLFRVVVVSGLAWGARRLLGWSTPVAGVFAVVVGALVFSAFHYVGSYGDPFAVGSFTFRAIAGVLFSALYLLRGFGIAAWTHALYDVFLTL